jgi:hypothetical protein
MPQSFIPEHFYGKGYKFNILFIQHIVSLNRSHTEHRQLDFPLDLKSTACQHLRRLWGIRDFILEMAFQSDKDPVDLNRRNGKDKRWWKKVNF